MAKRIYATRWCFTINNPTEKDDPEDHSVFKYIVIGKETGDEGTYHMQGFCIMNKRMGLPGMKKIFPRAHLEIAKGTNLQASDYCKKDGDYVEMGTLPEEANVAGGRATKRNWDAAWELAKSGDFEQIDKDILFPYYPAAKRIRQDYQVRPKDLDDVCGEWFYGPPDTGKSMTAREENPDFYDKPCNKWWDGYRGEPVAIIDDFDVNHKVLGHHLKRWADRYSFPAEHKGTTIQIRPTKILVTSNYSISDIFFEDPTLVAALSRRFVVRVFNK